MFETLNQDRYTIMRKYHDPEKEYDPLNRFAYHGYDYDPSTGLGDAEIDAGLAKLADELQGQPHALVKSRLFEYVLDHTMIDVNEHDYYVGIYTWGRVLDKYTVDRWRKELYAEYPEVYARKKELDYSGVAHGWLDFDHTIPHWDSMMELGLPGLLKRAEDSYEALKANGILTEKQENFFLGMQREYRAFIRLIDRMYQYALTRKFEKAPRIAACLKHLRDGAPTNTYEALQLIYLYFMISESVDHYQVRSLGYGLDGTLYPFYCNDLKNGTYTKEELGEFIGYFLLQWAAIDNYWGQPFYLAGTNLDGTTKVNELSYLILDVYDKLGLFNPKIQIKISKSTPKDFVLKALEMIRHGVSSIVFCNEDIIVKALMSRGASYEEAVDSSLSGCYEYKVKAKDIGISSQYFNALKPISLVFDNGFDSITGKQIGLKTGNVEEFTSFKQFYNAYLTQFGYTIREYMKIFDILETQVNDVNPSLLYSGTIPSCVETMTDALDCGMENVSGTLLCALATAVDALMAVYELVFEKKVTTLAELKKALDADWEGYENLRAQALSCKHKYGNDDPMADNYAVAIVRFVHDQLAGRINSHGGKTLLEAHSARAFVIHGVRTKATPDGRKFGDETSKNASPTPGADRNGITALINSVTQIDTALCNTGFCLDAMLHPSAVQGEDGLMALYAVLDTYMKKGGASIHFNIFDSAMLRDAQDHPEKYQNLQVRVCGWNILWNNMDRKEQDAYILRAENIL